MRDVQVIFSQVLTHHVIHKNFTPDPAVVALLPGLGACPRLAGSTAGALDLARSSDRFRSPIWVSTSVKGREKLCSQISEITGTEVIGLFTDVETQIGERMIVFTLAKDLDPDFR